MFGPPNTAGDRVIIFNEVGQRIWIDANSIMACISVEQLMHAVGRVSLPYGEHCYGLLQLLPAYGRENPRYTDVTPSTLAAMQDHRCSSAPSAALPASTSTRHLDATADMGELRNLSLTEKPSSMTRRQALRGAAAVSNLRASFTESKTWSCPPLASLPLCALRQLENWPLQSRRGHQAAVVATNNSLSQTLPLQGSPAASSIEGASALPATSSPLAPEKRTSRGSTAKFPQPAPAATAHDLKPADHSSAAVTSKQEVGAATCAASTMVASQTSGILPGGAIVLIALCTAVPRGGRAVEVRAYGAEVMPHTPDARAAVLHRPQSCQSMVSPTGKYLPMDVLLQSSSSAQYGLSSGRNTGVSGNSFTSFTTPLAYGASTPTALRGPPQACWSTATTTTVGSPGIVNVVGAASAWAAPNLSDSFSPSMAAYSIVGENASIATGITNNSFAAAPLLFDFPQHGTRICVAQLHEAFPTHVGKMRSVKCVYGDSRFSRGAAAAVGNVSEADSAGRHLRSATSTHGSTGLLNTLVPSTSGCSGTAAGSRGTGGALSATGSGGSFISSANNSFASPFGTAGMMQPVPCFAPQRHAPPHLKQQQHQHQYQHAQHQRSPLARAAAAAALGHSAPPHTVQCSPGDQQHFFFPAPSSGTLVSSPPPAHPLPAAHLPWRNAVPPLPKATVSFAIALHIGRNKDVIRCLLQHYIGNEVELVMKALKRSHPFLRCAAAQEYVFGDLRVAADDDVSDVEESGGGSDVNSSTQRSGVHQDDEGALLGGGALQRSSSGCHTRRSGANFTPTVSVDLDAPRRRTLTASQAIRKVLLYRQYFAYVGCCMEQDQADLNRIISDVDQATREVQLTSSSSVSTPSSALSMVRARPCVSGAYYVATDEDEVSAPCATKSTVAPSARSCESAERTSASQPLTVNRSGDSFSYNTSDVYSLARTLRLQSSSFEESTKRENGVPPQPCAASAAVWLDCEEAYCWLKLTPQTKEVSEVLSRPLSYMDRARVAQLQRLRRNLMRAAPRTASELRSSQLHLLLRGACDDEAAAMEGLKYLMSVAKGEACADGGVARSPNAKPALARAFATIQKRNEEMRWFNAIEGAVARRLIRPTLLLEVVTQLEQDPNAVMDLWYNAEEETRETLRLTSQYLTRRFRAG